MTTGKERDAAWVSVATPLPASELRELCADIERLYRINPLLEFSQWRNISPDRFHMSGTNTANARPFDLDCTVKHLKDGFEVRYDSGLKRFTRFRIEDAASGARLVVTEDYGRLPEEQRKARIDEVDTTLVPWGNALWRYFRQWRRWSWLPPWRWYMTRYWQSMKPSARRIVSLILLVTIAEFIAFLFVFTIFWLEM